MLHDVEKESGHRFNRRAVDPNSWVLTANQQTSKSESENLCVVDRPGCAGQDRWVRGIMRTVLLDRLGLCLVVALLLGALPAQAGPNLVSNPCFTPCIAACVQNDRIPGW